LSVILPVSELIKLSAGVTGAGTSKGITLPVNNNLLVLTKKGTVVRDISNGQRNTSDILIIRHINEELTRVLVMVGMSKDNFAKFKLLLYFPRKLNSVFRYVIVVEFIVARAFTVSKIDGLDLGMSGKVQSTLSKVRYRNASVGGVLESEGLLNAFFIDALFITVIQDASSVLITDKPRESASIAVKLRIKASINVVVEIVLTSSTGTLIVVTVFVVSSVRLPVPEEGHGRRFVLRGHLSNQAGTRGDDVALNDYLIMLVVSTLKLTDIDEEDANTRHDVDLIEIYNIHIKTIEDLIGSVMINSAEYGGYPIVGQIIVPRASGDNDQTTSLLRGTDERRVGVRGVT
jgi:hypothetical protein